MRHFAGGRETHAEPRTPGEPARADRLRRPHRASELAVLLRACQRGAQQYRFG